MERKWHHLVQRQTGLQKDFAEIFDKIPLAENREDEVCKLTVSMDLIVDIRTTGNDEVESLRWEGIPPGWTRGPVFSNTLTHERVLMKFVHDTKFRGIMNS